MKVWKSVLKKSVTDNFPKKRFGFCFYVNFLFLGFLDNNPDSVHQLFDVVRILILVLLSVAIEMSVNVYQDYNPEFVKHDFETIYFTDFLIIIWFLKTLLHSDFRKIIWNFS